MLLHTPSWSDDLTSKGPYTSKKNSNNTIQTTPSTAQPHPKFTHKRKQIEKVILLDQSRPSIQERERRIFAENEILSIRDQTLKLEGMYTALSCNQKRNFRGYSSKKNLKSKSSYSVGFAKYDHRTWWDWLLQTYGNTQSQIRKLEKDVFNKNGSYLPITKPTGFTAMQNRFGSLQRRVDKLFNALKEKSCNDIK